MPVKQVRNTALATIRFDIRTIATIARFYTIQGRTFRSKSDLINRILIDFKTLVINDNQVEEFNRTDRAHLFLSNLNLNFRHKSTDAQYLKQLKFESLSSEEQENSPDEPIVDKGKIAQVIRENM